MNGDMIGRIPYLMLIVLFPIAISAQTRKVSGEYTYYGNQNQSIKEAKAAAIEHARVKALAKEFGTLIIQDFIQEEERKGDKEQSYVMLMSAAEVKGEWIEDLKKPEVKVIDITEDGVIVVKAKVEGKARAIENDVPDFDVLTLRNGTSKRYANTDFKDDDKLYLYFKAPADGYVAAYLIDEQQMVTCLIPHEGDSDGQQPVKHDKEYIFFSEKYDPDFQGEDGLVVTCDDERLELNRIYVIYSPNSFFKANDHAGERLDYGNLYRPRQLSLKDFSSWMSKLCARDKKMGRKVIRLKISKNTSQQ